MFEETNPSFELICNWKFVCVSLPHKKWCLWSQQYSIKCVLASREMPHLVTWSWKCLPLQRDHILPSSFLLLKEINFPTSRLWLENLCRFGWRIYSLQCRINLFSNLLGFLPWKNTTAQVEWFKRQKGLVLQQCHMHAERTNWKVLQTD